jgi:branched-chain amino acid transport system permease protein
VTEFWSLTILGIVTGCLYALSAAGLVVTYTTSGVFNFGHGAIGMFAALAFWQLSSPQAWGLPRWLAFILVVLVGAPLFGALIERVLMRRLYGASLEVSLVVTLGLLVFLLGLAFKIWDPSTTTRYLPRFFGDHHIRIGGLNVNFHQILIFIVAIALAVGLRLFFSKTRTGIAMRAVVDNRDLVSMAGGRPVRIAQLSWALGATLAALAGVLLAPLQSLLNIPILTLIIINAFAPAVVGRLRSLPMTVVGAFIVGLVEQYAKAYLPNSGFLSAAKTAVPMIVLFAAVILMRQERLRTSTVSTLRVPHVPSLTRSVIAGAVFVVAAIVVAQFLSPVNLAYGGAALAVAVALLSLVLLTGYGGQISLAQMTFIGIGAYAMAHISSGGSLLGVVGAMAATAACGALVALPTLRVRGLYLALATISVAYAMDQVFFQHYLGPYGQGLTVSRIHIPGLSTKTDRTFFVVIAVIFALVAIGVLAIRRGRWGRRLAALNDSPQACATLGLNVNWTKLAVFAVATGIAGLGGVLFAGNQHLVVADDFQMFNSLTLLLILLIGGRNTVAGAFLGGVFYALYPLLAQHVHALSTPGTIYLLTGIGAITIGRNPNGLGGYLASAGGWLRGRRMAAAVPGVPGVPGVPAVPAPAFPPAAEQEGHLARVAH